MTGIVVAMPSEAKPLVTFWNLKKNLSSHAFELFENERVCLIVSGVGKIKSASAVTYLIQRVSTLNSISNIGICGSAKEHPIGNLYQIHQVIDHASGPEFYPDMVVKSEIEEESLRTFDKPVSTGLSDVSLVDMEGSGFFQAASLFIPVHKIHIFKIVSDHLEFSGLNRDLISELILKKADILNSILTILEKTIEENVLFSDSEIRSLEDVIENLKLSESQKIKFEQEIKRFKVKNGNFPDIQRYTTIEVKDKPHARTLLSELYAELV